MSCFGAFRVRGYPQKAHHEMVREKLTQVHESMRDLMRSTHETFRSEVEEVIREWQAFVEQIDRSVEDALRQTVKKSLQELSRSINGDAKTEVQALFRISVVLRGDDLADAARVVHTAYGLDGDADATVYAGTGR